MAEERGEPNPLGLGAFIGFVAFIAVLIINGDVMGAVCVGVPVAVLVGGLAWVDDWGKRHNRNNK